MNKLLYGKNETERIVGIEPQDDFCEIFIEKDGKIISEFVPNKYWILAHEKLNNGFVRLRGDLHYKWGIQFTKRSEYQKFRNVFKANDTFSIYDPKESFMVNKGFTYYKGMSLKDVSILSFDIESTGLKHDNDAKVLIISNTIRKNGTIVRKLFTHDEFDTNGEMIDEWCQWVRDQDPSIICGHNIFGFDFGYLAFCAARDGYQLQLGRNGSNLRFEDRESKFRKDQTQDLHYFKAHIYGREIIDTMFLSIKYDIASKKYESYGLKQIIKQEGLEVKDRQFYDASTIRDNYKDPNEWEKIKKYAIHDADDALALFDLMAPSQFMASQIIPKSFQAIVSGATGSQINSIMIRAYLQEAHSLPKESPAVEYEGAISLGNPGLYRNALKVDVSSLYPSIMIAYKVYDENKDPEGKFLELVETLTKERLINKQKAKTDKYFDDLQSSQKILINSAYGFLGTTGLLFNSPSKAAFITRTGREILQRSIKWSEDHGFILTNADTDSIMFCKKDQSEFSEREQDDLLNDLNSLFPKQIHFEHDGLFAKILILKAKNYALWDGKKLKIKGSALRSGTKEPALRDLLNDVLNALIFDSSDPKAIYEKYVQEALNVTDIKRWCGKKTITEKTLNSERLNETKVKDAIAGSEYVEGDKIYTFFKQDGTLELMENFNGDYSVDRLLKKIYNTIETFETVLPVKEIFLNYSLKKNKKLLTI